MNKMEEEIVFQKTNINNNRYSLNNGRSLNIPFVHEPFSGNVDPEILAITNSFLKLLSKKETDIQGKTNDCFEFLKKYKEEKIEAVIKRMCEEIFREGNRNLIIASQILPDSKNPQKDPDMIVFELGKKQQKLEKIFQTLKEMNLLDKPLFRTLKSLILEGSEKLAFAIRLRKMQINNSRSAFIYAEHDNIVKKVMANWRNLKLISETDVNPGFFYTRIDNVEDFLYEAVNISQEAMISLKNGNFDELILLVDYFLEFLEVLQISRKKYGEYYTKNLGFLWILKEKNQGLDQFDLIETVVERFLMKLVDLKKKSGKMSEKFMEKYKILCEKVLWEIHFQSQINGKKSRNSIDVYECLIKMGLVERAFELALQEQEYLIINKIYCLHNIGSDEIKKIMEKDEKFLSLFIDFFIAFWKYHMENTENYQNITKEFRLFLDFQEFQPFIENYMQINYPHLNWLFLLKKSLENPNPSKNMMKTLLQLLKEETSVRMRRLLEEYFKAFLIMEKNQNKVNVIFDRLMAIDDIQIKFTKQPRISNLMGIVNFMTEEKNDKKIIICQSLNLVRNYLDLREGETFIKLFDEDPNELLIKILKLAFQLDEGLLREIFQKLKLKFDKNESSVEFNEFGRMIENDGLHELITQLTLWDNFSSIREISEIILNKNDWQEVKEIFPWENEENRDYFEFLINYINVYFENSNKIK